MAGNDPKGNGWNEWKRLVLSDLEDLKSGYGTLKSLLQSAEERQHKMELNLVELTTEVRVKARFQGALFGSIAGSVFSICIGLIIKHM